ncbi:LPP20 family lipoprotein [Sulfurimonas sp.]|uniref:LPP20 family lipoprotein n=1 Tax=Sulfurimonas sp. TaxID=2022749 RepID=UPI0035695518
MFKSALNTLVLSFVFFMSGCGGASGPSTSELPKWFLNPPASNPVFYYGVGEGDSVDAAKANALAQIGGTISTSVSSDLEINTNVTNDVINENIKSQTKSSIEKIKFTGAEVVENAQSGGKIYTLVKVDRGVLFSAQKSEMDISYNKMNSLYESSKNGNVLDLMKNTTSIHQLANNVSVKLPILKAISSDFNKAKYEKEILDIFSTTRDAKRKAMVYVSYDKNAKGEAAVVKNHISSYGMTLVSNPSSVKTKKNLLKLHVSKTAKKENVKTNDPRLKGASFARVVVTLDTKDYANKTLANNRIEVINISKDGYNAAVAKTKKFEREIDRRGILKILLDSAK